MKFFAASYFLHTFVTESSGERPACEHAGCEAGLEESTLLQLNQLKHKAKTQSNVDVDVDVDAGSQRAALIDQRIITGLEYMKEHQDQDMKHWMDCIDQIGSPQRRLEKGTFDAWNACLDSAEQAEGITDWLSNGRKPMSLTASTADVNASLGNPLSNYGRDCWGSCGGEGTCSWCGSEGACCRDGWNGPSECGGLGGDGYHMCMLRVDGSSTPVRNAGGDCWESCGHHGGVCSHCGPEGACCRQGWNDNGCASGRGGNGYHTCIYRTPARDGSRAGYPHHCESDRIDDDHECSCTVVRWRRDQIDLWDQYTSGYGTNANRVSLGRKAAVERCGFICPTRAGWEPARGGGHVMPGDVWETEYGFMTSDEWSSTRERETTVEASISTNVGFEFEGLGFGMDSSVTESARSMFSTTITQGTENTLVETRSRTWNSMGFVWQARATTRDTCGGSFSVLTDTMALTPRHAVKPVCYPGHCFNNNQGNYCCSCATGDASIPAENFIIPNSQGSPRSCPGVACGSTLTVEYTLHNGRNFHTLNLQPGEEIQHGRYLDVPCGTSVDGHRFDGNVRVTCNFGGLGIDAPHTQCDQSR